MKGGYKAFYSDMAEKENVLKLPGCNKEVRGKVSES